MKLRFCTLHLGGKHVALWWGRWCVNVVWPLAVPRAWRPYWSFTAPSRSGGTLVLRVGAVMLIHQGGRR